MSADANATLVREILRADGELVLSRERPGDERSVLILHPSSSPASRRCAEHLEHEYSLREQLDPAWAARPTALSDERGRLELRLDDPGGRLLSMDVGRPWEIARFLRIAINLAQALAAAHARGLIHRDIRPANILTDEVTRHVWLTGFGMASDLPRERRAPDPPQLIVGTLQYLAPEQTGRMNRSVDSRSDLYSLGVTFYELLTGELPFSASDPLAWVHCHIAVEAPRADRRCPGVPEQLGLVVARLLEKSADARYQTAAGLEADLRRCLADPSDRFPLGSADVSDRLLIPEKLYGREADIAVLTAAFDRVVDEGTLGVLLVSGYSGIGKSSVVNELHKSLVPPRGLFAAGKFDQYRRDIPYATLAQALRHLVQMVLVETDAELQRWRVALSGALVSNGALIASLIPEIEQIIGPCEPVPELPPREAQNRFQMVFHDFIRVFARPEHPLALFLDDLQWLDVATLTLLESIVATGANLSLLLIGAYRSNEVDAAHPLGPALDAIRQSSVHLQQIELRPLRSQDVASLVSDALRDRANRSHLLSATIYERAGGNPFFTIEFLLDLAHERLVFFDATTSAWSWDVGRILAKGYTNNVVDLMAAKLARLSAATQDALKDLSCLGSTAAVARFALIRASSIAATDTHLSEAIRAGAILRDDRRYRFVHDRVQEAAYSLIPEGERAATHLRIGRLLLSTLTESESGQVIFDIVSQFSKATDLVTEPDERAIVRQLNARAGRIAKGSTAFASARAYFAAGANLAEEDSWSVDYPAHFELHLLLAECEYLTGNFDVAEAAFKDLLGRARSKLDKAAVYRVRLHLYQVAGRWAEGLSLAREALGLFDIHIPQAPAEITSATEAACREVWNNLRGRRIAGLVDAPETDDPELAAVLEIVINAGPCAFNGGPELYPLVVVTGVNMSLRHGHNRLSSFPYVAYAVVLVALGDISAAVAFTDLALRLSDRFDNPRLRGQIFHCHAHYVLFWKHHFRQVLPWQDLILKTCLECGDFSYAGFNRFVSIWHLLEAGLPLDEVLSRSEGYADVCRQTNNAATFHVVCLERQFIVSLQGRTYDPLGMSDASFDEAASLAALVQATFGCGLVFYYVMKQYLAFVHGRYRESVAAAKSAEVHLGSAMAMALGAEHHLLYGLAAAALAEQADVADRGDYERVMLEAERRFAFWARECPENFSGRHALLGAEIARVEGRTVEALVLFETAIRAARTNGFVRDEAMALELAGKLHALRGLETGARAHYRAARDAYARWGAHGKVVQLEREHPDLAASVADVRSHTTFGTPVEYLDLDTVVRVLQALTREIVLEKLVERLMLIALEDAGAQRGVLLVADAGQMRAVSEAAVGSDGVIVRRVDVPEETSLVPSSILRYVMRSKEALVLDDASDKYPFAGDPDVVGRQCRSILCVPLVNQGKTVGVLYLENKLARGVFTPRRAAIMGLVASQAAISLENARLHTDLTLENDARRRTEDALRQSQAYAVEAQRLSRTGSFGWNVATGALLWSDETYRITGIDVSANLTLADAAERIHPEDVALVKRHLEGSAQSGSALDFEHRYLMPDGSTKFVRILGRPVQGASGAAEYIGAMQDVTEQRVAEAALQQAHDELARVMRATALGELAASIAHEVNQPLAAISADAAAAMNWLDMSPPAVDNIRQSLAAIVSDSERASDVVSRIRSFLTRSPQERARCDLNALVLETGRLVRAQLERARVLLEAELMEGLPMVLGDHVQLQQVLLNLTLNALDACKDLGPDRRHVWVRTSTEARAAKTWATVEVCDRGRGIAPGSEQRLFDAFFTTKSGGIGMGLAISRSIVSQHEGKLGARPNVEHGSIFSFCLPALP